MTGQYKSKQWFTAEVNVQLATLYATVHNLASGSENNWLAHKEAIIFYLANDWVYFHA